MARPVCVPVSSAPRRSGRAFADIESRVTTQLTNQTMNDGSRKFAELPQTRLWHELRDHLQVLDGAVVTDFLTDGITEAWIDFTFRGHSFTINDQFGVYWFFVDDPSCPDEILTEVLRHCQGLLSA
jgi:hypothetical protein